MRSFEEYWMECGDVHAMDVAEQAYEAGQESRQTEVDELQNRVDAALKMISLNRGFAFMPESISELEQVLKGGAHEK